MIVLAFLAGIPLAWGWGKYLAAVSSYSKRIAAMWDIIVILLASALTLTLWSESGNNILILIAYAFGSGIGTYYVVGHNKKMAKRKTERQ
jgi:uncharacterized protein YebE (UPF0316 family)